MDSILAADIGGTNARFAVFSLDGDGALVMGESIWLETGRCASFADLVGQLEVEHFPLLPRDADVVGLAVAGPVHGRAYSDPPNIPWDVDLAGRDALLFKDFTLINDFTAQACACMTPIFDEALLILPGKAEPDTTRAVIGAGTGLGMAALVPDGAGGYRVMPTEGGHSLFPFVSREEFDFMDFVRDRTGRRQVIGDLVVTGLGLSLLHEFFTGERLAPAEVTAGFYSKSKILAWAARFYGRACRNFALSTLALGGVTISGGVAARSPELVTHPAFGDAFRFSETHAAVMERIPVMLNANEASGLWGAAHAALHHARTGGHVT
ncbi:glucokinase [Desulfobaculum sp. SPO524]|uniref:glucokinase n=1 Tax=Desulfobaculum sp. SPO524 TaxID=3378071 RepID=UPI003854FC86